jgi:hypothetical protein
MIAVTAIAVFAVMILVLFSALWNFTIGSITFDKTS